MPTVLQPHRASRRIQVTRILRVWGWAILVGLFASGLIVLQDLLYGGLPTETPASVAIAQYTLPWITWALLAPLMLYLFAHFPIDLQRPARALGLYLAIGVLIVGVKLVVTAPAAAILIWQPLSVGWRDGVRWLLANRAASNLLMFWLFLTGYTAFRYYRAAASAKDSRPDLPALVRLPVRAGHGTSFVCLNEVSFIEADRNQLLLYTGKARHPVRSTLGELESRLPGEFVRVHRSRIVNIDHVSRIEPWGRGDFVLILRDGTRLVSGKTYRDAIRRLLDGSEA
jgi:hypothetical protein